MTGNQEMPNSGGSEADAAAGSWPDPDLDLNAGTLTLHWRDSAADRSAMLFLGHVLRRSGSRRGRMLLELARGAGGVFDELADDELVDDFL